MIELLSTMTPTLDHWLVLSTALFSIGLYGLLVRSNAICVLMSIELMLNSAAINLVAYNYYLHPKSLEGETFVLFIIAVAAAEAVAALAIFVTLFAQKQTLNIQTDNVLKG